MNTTARFLSLILAACAAAQVQAEDDLRPQAQRAPGSGQLLREVHQQQLAQALGTGRLAVSGAHGRSL